MSGFFLVAMTGTAPGLARIRYCGASGASLWLIVERLATGMFWDGAGFSASPLALQAKESTVVCGLYALDIPSGAWADGQYAVWPVIPGPPPIVDTRYGLSSFLLRQGDDGASSATQLAT
jgi:hypothetical protein